MEVFKDVVGYEGFYKISNIGNVKSLSRTILKNGIYPFKSKEKILKIDLTIIITMLLYVKIILIKLFVIID